MKAVTLTLAILAAVSFTHSQFPPEIKSKLEVILEDQDRRMVGDGKLTSLFDDLSPIVRERVTEAFGSIQDTTVIGQLVDRFTFDADDRVRYAAAFAIGQTAGQMSQPGRQKLSHEIIWVRLERMTAGGSGADSSSDRMIEEIGKFGTHQALNDLVLKYGNIYPPVHQQALVMGLARFAIRGISTSEGTQYLIKLIKPYDQADWRIVYALQRIGEREEIRSELENVALLYQHADPLVRMNLATLLGKVKDERICLPPLARLAEFDADWRVQVNALRALANYDLRDHPDIVDMFRRLFLSGKPYLALTALSSFGNLHLPDRSSAPEIENAFAQLERIAINQGNGYLWQLQGEAMLAMAKLEGPAAVGRISVADKSQRGLQGQLLQALGYSGSKNALGPLLAYAGGNDVFLACAALEGLGVLGHAIGKDSASIRQISEAALHSLQSQDVARVATAASLLGDSLFLKSSSLPALVRALDESRVPDDVEAIQALCETLGKLGDSRAIGPLRHQLGQKDRSVVSAASNALNAITGKSYAEEIPAYFEPLYKDFDYDYLHGLRDSLCGRGVSDTICARIETSRGTINIEMYKNVAPFTVMSIVKLATRRGFYRGLTFHRIVPNFVVQGGDPRGDGWGGPGYSIRSEFSLLHYDTGMLGIASSGKDTEGSQFFITQSPQPHLDGRYTIFGKVVSGMDVVNALQLDDHMYDLKILP